MCKVNVRYLDTYFVAGRLGMGVPVNRILEDIRSMTIEGEIKRIHLLEKKDTHNIRRDINIAYSTKRHEHDSEWVQEMMDKGDESPILYSYYKEQGKEGISCFTKVDFCLIIMTKFQSELLLKFGCDKICINGTHLSNGFNFQLYSLVVVDEFGNGYPVPFSFSNKSDSALYKHYFRYIKNVIGNITLAVFMSNDEPAFYKA